MRQAGAVFNTESCVARTLGDQVFANTVAYRSHSDTNSKVIRKLRSDGPTFHDRLHLSNSTPAGLSWGSIWRLETTEEVSPPSLGEMHLGVCSGSLAGGPEAPQDQGLSVLQTQFLLFIVVSACSVLLPLIATMSSLGQRPC